MKKVRGNLREKTIDPRETPLEEGQEPITNSINPLMISVLAFKPIVRHIGRRQVPPPTNKSW